MATIAICDDHVLLRNGLTALVRDMGHDVVIEAGNGEQLVEKLSNAIVPQLVLLDINMPVLDGYATAQHLRTHFPDVKVLSLSMYDNEASIIRMLKCGAKGYILKDCEPQELKAAIDAVLNKGFYYNELVSGRLIHAINKLDQHEAALNDLIPLSEREREFLLYAATELTYKEIAEKMFLSPRTIDGYRDTLFEKLNVKTRVGLVLYAIKNKYVDV